MRDLNYQIEAKSENEVRKRKDWTGPVHSVVSYSANIQLRKRKDWTGPVHSVVSYCANIQHSIVNNCYRVIFAGNHRDQNRVLNNFQ